MKIGKREKINHGIPICCKTVTPQTKIRKQPKSENSIVDGLLNFLP